MEIHPQRMRWLVSRFLWLGAVIALLLIIISAVQKRSSTRVSEVEIEIKGFDNGNKFVRPDDVRDIIFGFFGNTLEGQPLGDIDLRGVEDTLESQPFIANADVYADAQDHIHISIVQREPIVRVMDVEDESYYLDEEGIRMPTSINYTARVLVLSGFIGRYVVNYQELEGNLLNRIFGVVRHIWSDPFLRAQIEQIHVAEDGELVLVPKLGDQKILFGPTNGYKSKFQRLKIFYHEAMPQEGWETYRIINLKYKNQVVCKKAN